MPVLNYFSNVDCGGGTALELQISRGPAWMISTCCFPVSFVEVEDHCFAVLLGKGQVRVVVNIEEDIVTEMVGASGERRTSVQAGEVPAILDRLEECVRSMKDHIRVRRRGKESAQ